MSAAKPTTGPAVAQNVAPAATRKGRWGSLTAMSFASVVDNFEDGLINTLFPVIRAALGLDLGALGVLPMVSAVVPPTPSATAFAILFSFVQGLSAAVLSLATGYLARTFGLQNVMFWMVTVPYAINAVFWFVFYRAYPRDVAAQQTRNAAQVPARVRLVHA